MPKCLAINTETGLEPTAQAGSVATAIKLAVLEKLAMRNFAPNDEIVITESGDFEIPYDGTYEVTCIGDGNGGFCYTYSTTSGIAEGGGSGHIYKTAKFYKAGTIVPVTIGAAGLSSTTQVPVSNPSYFGGITSFGDIVPGFDDKTNMQFGASKQEGAGSAGFVFRGDPALYHGYGAGARTVCRSNSNNEIARQATQGAVILRFFNPAKASLPTINNTDLVPFIELLNRVKALEEAINQGA